jgi:predicted ATP-grasp superfamily ATP-dependent carboligase
MEQFVRFFRRIQNFLRYEVIMPVGYTSTYFLSMNKKAIAEGEVIPVSDFSTLRIAANKRGSFLLAKEIGVPIPQTFFFKSSSELDDIAVKSYPIVVKGALEGGCVRYAYSKQDLINKFDEIYRLQGVLPVVQEFIRGQGYGFFGLFNHGKPRAVFMHKRVRERYVTGGPSTCAESVYERELLDYGLKILESLMWHGVAMVEFKRDEADGEFKMMEINPKFWGSLDLALACGVDFPFLLYKMAIDGDVDPVFSYKVPLRFMWPFPEDLLHVLNAKGDAQVFLTDLFDSSVKKNLSLADLNPALAPLLDGASLAVSKLFGKRE